MLVEWYLKPTTCRSFMVIKFEITRFDCMYIQFALLFKFHTSQHFNNMIYVIFNMYNVINQMN